LKRETYFPGAQFPAEVIDAAATFVNRFRNAKDNNDNKPLEFLEMRVARGHSIWTYDDMDSWLDDYRSQPQSATLRILLPEHGNSYNHRAAITIDIRFSTDVGPSGTTVSVAADSREKIDAIMGLFAATTGVPTPAAAPSSIALKAPMIFIGHGRSPLWRDLKDHLNHQHELNIQAYETGSRAGHNIRDILESMLADAAFAILVLTGEDATETGTVRARQNVVHEAGLFQGRLGWHRAILLVEEGVELFSNIDGVQQIRFSTGNIREAFGDVISTLHREFGRSIGRGSITHSRH
jgi:predicted nucleotide-binding protein